jgi:ubiquinone/menaquinone biosynthesis C-methylase UbiE
MSQDAAAGEPTSLLATDDLSDEDVKRCCAAAYADPAVQWLLGGELHPGGVALTRRTLELAELRAGERLLDVGCGVGTSARLAASEFSAEAMGVEYGPEAVGTARAAAAAAGREGQVRFIAGDAERLPVASDRFDVVLCECALCTFPDQRRAVAEFRRVLRSGGRLALSDVVVEGGSLAAALTGATAAIACVEGALSSAGYRKLLRQEGLTVQRSESRPHDIEAFVQRIEDRLRGARLLGIEPPAGSPLGIEDAIKAARQARSEITSGRLGYRIFVAQ